MYFLNTSLRKCNFEYPNLKKSEQIVRITADKFFGRS